MEQSVKKFIENEILNVGHVDCVWHSKVYSTSTGYIVVKSMGKATM